MKKIVLINPLTSEISRQKGVLPLALLSISTKLDQEDYEIVILDEALDSLSPEIFKNSICIGIGAMIGYQIGNALKIAKKIKAIYPETPLVWGGWHPSIEPTQTAENEYVDFVVRSQGEATFYELVKAIESGGDYEGILGLTFKKNGVVHHNSDRPLIDPNELEPLPYHLIDMHRYVHESELGKRTVTYLSSVGCPHRCGFCAEQLVHGRTWLPLSAERVVSDIQSLYDTFGIDSLFMSDSDFFINEKRTVEICKGLIDERIDIKWGNVNGRSDELVRYEDSTWELMEKSGLQSIATGAEASDEDALVLINKGATVADTIELAKIASNHNIIIKFSLMIGLPIVDDSYSMRKEFTDMIDFILSMYKISRNNEFLLFMYTPFPGTPLFTKSIELGFKSPATLDEWGEFITGLNTPSTPWTDMKIADRVYQVNFYFPFISSTAEKVARNSPIPLRWIALFGVKILGSLMRLRLKYKFFAFPFEYKSIRLAFKFKKLLIPTSNV
jgi:anaerobic magnesium-protoporphyrin IX monomethyl ester cyclase